MHAHDSLKCGQRRQQDPRVRALALWPRLDRRKLARTCGDPDRVARLIERRTALPHEAIMIMLLRPWTGED